MKQIDKYERKTITLDQIKKLKKGIDQMSRSDEQFIFMIFKNPDGTDSTAWYGYGIPPEKVRHYMKQMFDNGVILEEIEDGNK